MSTCKNYMSVHCNVYCNRRYANVNIDDDDDKITDRSRQLVAVEGASQMALVKQCLLEEQPEG